jgi:hypothetical protein
MFSLEIEIAQLQKAKATNSNRKSVSFDFCEVSNHGLSQKTANGMAISQAPWKFQRFLNASLDSSWIKHENSSLMLPALVGTRLL